jgi:hypothetical protein
MLKYSEWLIQQIISGNINNNDAFFEEVKKRAEQEKIQSDLLKNKNCPNCNRLGLYYRRSSNNWRCQKCKSIFSMEMEHLGFENN